MIYYGTRRSQLTAPYLSKQSPIYVFKQRRAKSARRCLNSMTVGEQVCQRDLTVTLSEGRDDHEKEMERKEKVQKSEIGKNILAITIDMPIFTTYPPPLLINNFNLF